ncbi:MAG: ATP-binding protein [Clostridia bacterium]|nr:ATP-binding protein [Clostridia bacterium]
MEIKRDLYLNKLIRHKHNGMIKVITGIRRCGKSYLLFELFYKHLLSVGVSEDHILKIALDDRRNKKFRNPDYLCDYVHDYIKDGDMYYILLDEVQLVPEFEDVLNSFLHIKNADTFVTGSNAKFLSKDIITEFRGRGDQIHIAPLSFSEFMSAFDGTAEQGWNQYINFGGLPKLFDFATEEDKSNYLKDIFTETYIKDIRERNKIRSDAELDELLDILSSAIGSLTNPKKLSDTFKSVKQVQLHPDTIKNYLDCFVDSFLIEQAKRYDIKGKRYINTPSKYYFTDIGLRNARLNFRQFEETHAMENVIYNELRIRGFNVDVGIVEYYSSENSRKSVLKQAEVDFVCNLSDKRYYIQSALSVPTKEKLEQEQNSLVRIDDSFKKLIIVKDISRSHYNEDGIYLMSLFDFLLNPDSLNF